MATCSRSNIWWRTNSFSPFITVFFSFSLNPNCITSTQSSNPRESQEFRRSLCTSCFFFSLVLRAVVGYYARGKPSIPSSFSIPTLFSYWCSSTGPRKVGSNLGWVRKIPCLNSFLLMAKSIASGTTLVQVSRFFSRPRFYFCFFSKTCFPDCQLSTTGKREKRIVALTRTAFLSLSLLPYDGS
jgi:hypothetical protein